jgi:hypothetical protein
MWARYGALWCLACLATIAIYQYETSVPAPEGQVLTEAEAGRSEWEEVKAAEEEQQAVQTMQRLVNIAEGNPSESLVQVGTVAWARKTAIAKHKKVMPSRTQRQEAKKLVADHLADPALAKKIAHSAAKKVGPNKKVKKAHKKKAKKTEKAKKIEKPKKTEKAKKAKKVQAAGQAETCEGQARHIHSHTGDEDSQHSEALAREWDEGVHHLRPAALPVGSRPEQHCWLLAKSQGCSGACALHRAYVIHGHEEISEALLLRSLFDGEWRAVQQCRHHCPAHAIRLLRRA